VEHFMTRTSDDTIESTGTSKGDDPSTQPASSRVDAGTKTHSGPLGRLDPDKPAPPGTVPRPPLGAATLTVLAGFIGLIASLFVLGTIAEGVRSHEVFALDTWATPFLHGMASPGLNAFMNTLTDFGSSPIIIPVFVAVVAVLLWKRRYGAAAFLGLASGGALVLDVTMKLFFQRPRQQLAWARVLPDYSFPSGHTMNAVVFYVALALILWSVFGRRTGLVAMGVAIVLALGVGVSRIYLGYHYLTDVVGGLMAGTAWLLVVGAAFRAQPTWWPWSPTGAQTTNGRDGPGQAAAR
jgi:undecaprenyl-diphosphatase